jgi:ribose 1,5-bisphosphokinase PhnN
VLKSHFFPTIIEKGVLHRGRFLAVMGPSQAEKDWCLQTADAVAQQPALLQ